MKLIDDLHQVVERLPEDRVREVLDFARFIAQNREMEEWRESGQQHLAKAYGPDEPEYTEADILKGEAG